METDRPECLEFYSTSSLEEMKVAIQAKPSARSLSLTQCPCLTSDESFRELVRFLNRNLSSLHVAQLTEFNYNSVALLTERCSNLKEIQFTCCPGIDNKSFKFVGEHCYGLKSFSCIGFGDNGGGWGVSDDALAEFVNHSNAPALEAVTFSGFSDISDAGVKCLIYKHGSTLTSIDLSKCKHITDYGVETIALQCPRLRFIRINATNVTDNGLKALGHSRPELCHLDVGNSNVTDIGVEYIAGACRHLEHIILENCERVTDISLSSLTKNCTKLKRVSFQNTCLTRIPFDIVQLSRLKELNVRMCKNLIFPKPEIVNSNSTYEIIMYFKEQYIGYRMRVLFVGERGSGKSSLIKSLKAGDAKNVTIASDDVTTELWFPFQTDTEDSDFNNNFSQEERTLCLELWDQPGSKISRRCQSLSMTNKCCLYVILSNMAEEGSLEAIEEHINIVQNKAPDMSVIIVGTHADMMMNADKRKEWLDSVEDILKNRKAKHEQKLNEELQHFGELDDKKSVKLATCRQKLSNLLQSRSNFKTSIVCTSIITGKGLDELRRVLITAALNSDIYPHMNKSVDESTSKLYNEIYTLKKQGDILLTSEKFKNLAASCDIQTTSEIEKVLNFLCERGVVSYAVECLPSTSDPSLLSLSTTDPSSLPSNNSDTTSLPSIICIYPAAIQDILYSIHLEDCRKAFKFETKRFWPKGVVNKKPDALILVRAIEEIPTKGMIRESLFPLMLQKLNLTEDQILVLVKYFVSLGIIVRKEVLDMNDEFYCLQLPLFPALSTQQHYYITWMDQLPDIEPRLNWTEAPFEGDLQVILQYDFPFGVPDGFSERLVSVCNHTCFRGRYKHHWQHGLLAKNGQVLIHMTSRQEGVSTIVFTARATVDEEGERKTTETLWVELANVLQQTEAYISQWPGLVSKVFVQPGPWYFDGEAPEEPVHIPLVDCFHFFDEGEDSLEITLEDQVFFVDLHHLLPLTDNNELNIQQWFTWLTSQEIENTLDPCYLLDSIEVIGAGELNMEKKVESNNKGRIKWDIGDRENGNLKDQHSAELQKVAAEFVAIIIAQSFSKLALEMEQNKQESERVDSKSLSLRMKPGKQIEKKLYGHSISKQPLSLRSKSPVKSKTCVIL